MKITGTVEAVFEFVTGAGRQKQARVTGKAQVEHPINGTVEVDVVGTLQAPEFVVWQPGQVVEIGLQDLGSEVNKA